MAPYLTDAAWAQVWVSLLGNVLLAITIFIGIQATKAATRAANAAEKGVEVGLRAYLTMELINSRIWDTSETPPHFLGQDMLCTVKNNGSTPATDVKLRTIVFALYNSEGRECTQIFNGTFLMDTIEQTGHTTVGMFRYRRNMMTKAYKKEFSLYIYLSATYKDVFLNNEIHKTTIYTHVLQNYDPGSYTPNGKVALEYRRLEKNELPPEMVFAIDGKIAEPASASVRLDEC